MAIANPFGSHSAQPLSGWHSGRAGGGGGLSLRAGFTPAHTHRKAQAKDGAPGQLHAALLAATAGRVLSVDALLFEKVLQVP